MKIVIPSLSRPEILKSRTLSTLEKYKIPKKSIYIFVIEEQLDLYKNIIGNEYNIIVGVLGISEQRAFISNYFEEGERLVSMDDDIKKILELKMKDNKKYLEDIEDFNKLIQHAFRLIDLEKASCCGVYPTDNPYYMSFQYCNNLKFCIGQLRFFLNNKSIEASRRYKLLEDYETSLKYFLKDKKIIRLNNICLEAAYNCLRGGLNSITDRSYETKKEEVYKFYEEYEMYCHIKDRETKSGMKIDIQFTRSKFF